MADIVIASNNKGKINDFKSIFPNDNVIGISEIIKDLEVEETCTTFEENERLKSEAAAKVLNKRVIADDSGLEVCALNGDPGVYSARYAGLDKNDEANIDKVLQKLEGETNRKAQFVCVISMSAPNEPTHTFKGTVSGEITTERKGDNGFGYDPIFYLPEKKKTMAELTTKEKSDVSHRGNAIKALNEYLEREQ